MSFLQKLKKLDRYMSEPAFYIRIEETDDDEKKRLKKENNELKRLLTTKRVQAIEAKCELLE